MKFAFEVKTFARLMLTGGGCDFLLDFSLAQYYFLRQ